MVEALNIVIMAVVVDVYNHTDDKIVESLINTPTHTHTQMSTS